MERERELDYALITILDNLSLLMYIQRGLEGRREGGRGWSGRK